jgi:hypothetical protein
MPPFGQLDVGHCMEAVHIWEGSRFRDPSRLRLGVKGTALIFRSIRELNVNSYGNKDAFALAI